MVRLWSGKQITTNNIRTPYGQTQHVVMYGVILIRQIVHELSPLGAEMGACAIDAWPN